MRWRGRVALCLCLAAWQASCAAPQPLQPLGEPPIVLLGEMHDNGAQPAQQAAALRDVLRSGARPALLMEQFDRERQRDIDIAQAAGADAERLIAAGSVGAGPGASRWDWSRYRSLIELALAHGLPIVAANVSRADARKVIADGLAAHGFDARVPDEILEAQAAAIEHGHCGTIDAATARRMAGAQVARDQFMAQQVRAHAARGVLLIAGHGHVRRDIGVPRWLGDDERRRATVVGLVEPGTDTAAFDRVIVSAPPQQREDPCAALRPRG